MSTDVTGRIVVDEHTRTSSAHICATDDCSTMPHPVYVKAAAGTRATINMTGGDATCDLSIVPAVVFTDRAIATVGLYEGQSRAEVIEPINRRFV